MSRRERQIPEPRIWSHEDCAARLNKSVPWFYDHRARLEQLGMPKKDVVLGGWDSKAFEGWLDSRSLPKVSIATQDEMLEAARGKN